MEDLEDSPAWNHLRQSLGRYVIAAGRAEHCLFGILRELQRITKQPVSSNPPTWSVLVQSIQELPPHDYSGRIEQLLMGASRRGRIRNNMIHTNWFSANADGYAGKRLYSKRGASGAIMFTSREVLDANVRTMEWFATEVSRLHGELASRPRA